MGEEYFLSRVVESEPKTTLRDFLPSDSVDATPVDSSSFVGKPKNIKAATEAKTYDKSVLALSDAYYRYEIDTFTGELIDQLPEQSRDPFILTAQTHVTKSTPLKVFALARGLGVPIEKARNLAGTVDALFLLSLMIDDIKDADTTRNGEKTAWSQFGTQRTVKSIHDISETTLGLVERDFGIASRKICQTDCEIGLRSLQDQRRITLDSPIGTIIHDWDRRLFFVSHFPIFACEHLMGSSNAKSKYMSAYKALQLTMRVGQLCNDLNDFTENRFSDWKNGCITLPVKMLFQRADPALTAKLQTSFGQEEVNGTEKLRVLGALKQHKIGRDLMGLVFSMYEKSFKCFSSVAQPEFITLFEEWMNYKRRGLQKIDLEI